MPTTVPLGSLILTTSKAKMISILSGRSEQSTDESEWIHPSLGWFLLMPWMCIKHVKVLKIYSTIQINGSRPYLMRWSIMRPNNRWEDPPTLKDLGRLRPLKTFFQVIIWGRESPTIGLIKGGAVFLLVLKNLLNSVLFVATMEVKLYFIALQGVAGIALKSITKSVINK